MERSGPRCFRFITNWSEIAAGCQWERGHNVNDVFDYKDKVPI